MITMVADGIEVQCDLEGCDEKIASQAPTTLAAWWEAADAGWANREMHDGLRHDHADLCPTHVRARDRGWITARGIRRAS